MPWDSSVDISQLTTEQKKEMVVRNPHIATWFFKMKVEAMIEKLIPIFGIKHYWFRIEGQHRGSDHIHGCFWFANAPNLTELSRMIKLGFLAELKLSVKYGIGDHFGESKKPWFQCKRQTFPEDEEPSPKVADVVAKFKRKIRDNITKYNKRSSPLKLRDTRWYVMFILSLVMTSYNIHTKHNVT